MEYVKVADKNELTKGNKKKVVLGGKEILIINLDNQYYAIDNRCPHMGGSLFEGTIKDGQVICPRHGSVFDVRTGKVVEAGSILFIKVKVDNLQSYPVKVQGNDLFVGIG